MLGLMGRYYNWKKARKYDALFNQYSDKYDSKVDGIRDAVLVILKNDDLKDRDFRAISTGIKMLEEQRKKIKRVARKLGTPDELHEKRKYLSKKSCRNYVEGVALQSARIDRAIEILTQAQAMMKLLNEQSAVSPGFDEKIYRRIPEAIIKYQALSIPDLKKTPSGTKLLAALDQHLNQALNHNRKEIKHQMDELQNDMNELKRLNAQIRIQQHLMYHGEASEAKVAYVRYGQYLELFKAQNKKMDQRIAALDDLMKNVLTDQENSGYVNKLDKIKEKKFLYAEQYQPGNLRVVPNAPRPVYASVANVLRPAYASIGQYDLIPKVEPSPNYQALALLPAEPIVSGYKQGIPQIYQTLKLALDVRAYVDVPAANQAQFQKPSKLGKRPLVANMHTPAHVMAHPDAHGLHERWHNASEEAARTAESSPKPPVRPYPRNY